MIQFEDVFGPVLDQGGYNLGACFDGEDLREWIYYTQSEDGFTARFDHGIPHPEVTENPVLRKSD